jgi:hypothetical protein
MNPLPSSSMPLQPSRPWPAPGGLPLWPLALLAGTLPCAAALLSWWLSTRLGLIPSCNVFIDGCVSVSRAARYELPNHLFRALMLPSAALQALVWLLAAHWLRQLGVRWRGIGWMTPLGICAAVALVLYGTFLGTEGDIYRWLRRYGTVVYFGFTCLCLLLAGGGIQRAAAAGWLSLPRWQERTMVTLATCLVLLGLGNAIIAAVFGEPLKTRVENVTEWWGALIFVLGFWYLAAIWWRQGLKLGFAPSSAGPSRLGQT